LRFYYATSTDLAHTLFAGAFRHDLNSLINAAERCYVPAENRCVLKLRQHFESSSHGDLLSFRQSDEPDRALHTHHVDGQMAALSVRHRSLHRAVPISETETGKT
jgi:hypothetical protein